MYKFDDQFIESIGLDGMPADQKEEFLKYAQEQLEIRIGERMSEGVPADKLDEFERIIDNDQATIDKWIAGAGDYQNDATYQKLVESLGDTSENILGDYATALWLNQNCPHYQDIIKESIEALRNEIVENRDAILASV